MDRKIVFKNISYLFILFVMGCNEQAESDRQFDLLIGAWRTDCQDSESRVESSRYFLYEVRFWSDGTVKHVDQRFSNNICTVPSFNLVTADEYWGTWLLGDEIVTLNGHMATEIDIDFDAFSIEDIFYVDDKSLRFGARSDAQLSRPNVLDEDKAAYTRIDEENID